MIEHAYFPSPLSSSSSLTRLSNPVRLSPASTLIVPSNTTSVVKRAGVAGVLDWMKGEAVVGSLRANGLGLGRMGGVLAGEELLNNDSIFIAVVLGDVLGVTLNEHISVAKSVSK